MPLTRFHPLIAEWFQTSIGAPTDVQAETIPRALAGKDLVVQSRTGTGKTAAFGIPIAERVDPGIDAVQVCFEVLFDPPAAGCLLSDSDCEDCPSTGSCLALSGTFFESVAHGEVDSSLDASPGCFVSLEPDPITWAASCIPGATPSACPLSVTSERTEFPLAGGRGTVVKVVTP